MKKYKMEDEIGMKKIKMKRMMRELREEGIVILRQKRVEIIKREKIEEIEEYDGELMRMEVLERKE